MIKRSLYILAALLLTALGTTAQTQEAADTIYNPDIIYSPMPRTYEIAGLEVTGIDPANAASVIGFSGLQVGDRVEVPGPAITNAVKRFWRQGMYSSIQIKAEKTVGDKIWLIISLKQLPTMSEIRFPGVKGSERKDLLERLNIVPGEQLNNNKLDRIKKIVEKYYADKGFKNAKVTLVQHPDLSRENAVILDIDVVKNTKVKVHKIYIDGNEVLSDRKLKWVMKKTNEPGNVFNLFNLFRQKKFVQNDFNDDRNRIIQKYNELGYRDAQIVSDSVVPYQDGSVDIYLNVDEGQKYYISDISWVGNTIYPTELLNNLLDMKPGDVYNSKLLNKRLYEDDDAIVNLYMDNGYLFFNVVPLETNLTDNTVGLQMTVMEGPQARINQVVINGNDRLYEKVIRRDLRVKPGELFSKSDLMRSAREIAASGHFNPENMDIKPVPNENDGTVDIVFNLEQKSNDKFQISFGWGQAGVTGQVGVSFTNFSLKNLFHPSSYKGIIPQGEGQTLSLSVQTNAKYYQSYNLSFFDPWVGGSRPNSISFSADYMRSTGINSSYYSENWANAYTNALYYGGTYGNYGYPYGNNYYGGGYINAYDPNKVIQIAGASLGYGTALTWPDDYFRFQSTLTYRWYYLKNWDYLYFMRNGVANSLALSLSLSRSSIDNPLYTRRGSEFSIGLDVTPPFSLMSNKDWKGLYYQKGEQAVQERYRWIEYWKLKFRSRTFTPLTDPDGSWTLVLMTRADFGLLGNYNRYLKTPFETFYFGGDGMTGSYTYATETIGMRGYENGQFTPFGYEGYSYGRFGMELHFPFMLQPSTTIYGLVFAEAGNAWTSVSKFSPFNLARSAGAGVRIYLSVIGFLGIDWGYGFDTVWGKKGGGHLHFVLGQEF